MASGQCLREFEGHSSWVHSVSLSPDGRLALSTGDKTLRLWDVETGRCLRTFAGIGRSVVGAEIGPDGETALSACSNFPGEETLHLWRLKTGISLPFVAVRPSDPVRLRDLAQEFVGLRSSASEALCDGDIESALTHLKTARQCRGYERNPDLLNLLGTASLRTRRCGFRGGWSARELKEDTRDAAYCAAISPDGRVGFSAGFHTRFWDLQTGELLHACEKEHDRVYGAAISPDGTFALSGGGDKVLRLWDVATGRCIRTIGATGGHSQTVHSVAISPDGLLGLSGSSDRTLRLWELNSGRCLRTFKGHGGSVQAVAIGPDGRFCMSGSGDERSPLCLWDLAGGQCLSIFVGHTNFIRSVAISPDGRRALSGSDDETLRLWDLETGDCLDVLMGHTSYVNSVAFSPDGRFGISGSGDGTLRLWDLSGGQCLRTFAGHTAWVSSVSLSLDGRWALSGSHDRTLRLWELDWDYEFPGWAEWDEGARPYLEVFLTLHSRYAKDGVGRVGRAQWSEENFQELLTDLQHRGYGWLRPEGVRRELEGMTRKWKCPKRVLGRR